MRRPGAAGRPGRAGMACLGRGGLQSWIRGAHDRRGDTGQWADGSARHRGAWMRAGGWLGRLGELDGARAGRSLALLFEQSGEAATFGQGELQGLDLPHQPAGAALAKEPLGPHCIALGGSCLQGSSPRDGLHRCGALRGLTPGKDMPGLGPPIALSRRRPEQQIEELVRRPPAAIRPQRVGAAKPGRHMLQGNAQVILQGLLVAGMGQGALEPGAPPGGKGEAAGPGPLGWCRAAEGGEQIRQEAIGASGCGGRLGSLQRCSRLLGLWRQGRCFWL